MGKIFGFVAVLVVGGVFFYFIQGSPKSETQVAPQAQSESASATPVSQSEASQDTGSIAASVPVAQEISVEANNWYFDPEVIRVKEGTVVKMTVHGVSGTHIFAIPEFSVKSKAVGPGETVTVEFVANKKGEFSFRCSLFCGEGHDGMRGTFIVE